MEIRLVLNNGELESVGTLNDWASVMLKSHKLVVNNMQDDETRRVGLRGTRHDGTGISVDFILDSKDDSINFLLNRGETRLATENGFADWVA